MLDEKLVSIVIPNLFEGKPGKIIPVGDEVSWFAQKCIERIKRFTHISYELILIDNGSTNQEASEFLKKEADIYIRFEKNQGFGRGCNAGFIRATGKYICCINNDVFVWDNWLEIMIQDYESNPNIGVLMPALMKQTKRGDKALEFETIDLTKNAGVVSPGAEFGSCWMISKKFFDELKEKSKSEEFPEGYYLDPTFFPGFGEDRDLWKRVRLAGKETYRTHNTRVFHQGNVTIGKLADRNKYISKNRDYLKKKYEKIDLCGKS